jgi:hypothetical protein
MYRCGERGDPEYPCQMCRSYVMIFTGVASYPVAEYLGVASSISNFDGKQTFPAEEF